MSSQMVVLQLHNNADSTLDLHHQLRSCSSIPRLRQLHSQVIRLGLSSHNHTVGRVINKYLCFAKQQSRPHPYRYHLHYYFHCALRLFHRIPDPDAFIYNIIFHAYLTLSPTTARRRILLLYSKMLHNSAARPNYFTFPFLLQPCCATGGAADEGEQLHAHPFKFGHAHDAYSLNNLMHMYATHGHLDKARRVFDRMLTRDAVSYTTMISGYAWWGRVDEAHHLFEAGQLNQPSMQVAWNAMIAALVQSNRFQYAFDVFTRRMRLGGVMEEEVPQLDKYVAPSMLSACAALGALRQGEWIHRYIEKSGMEVDPKLATSIIDMYCKCGCLDEALSVFHSLPDKGISSWNSIIGGLALHGRPYSAMQLFEKMSVTPDAVTMVNVLTACAHSGLVEEGRRYFQDIIATYGMEPGLEHYGCMVDLLGRAGLVEEAQQVVQEMPMVPDAAVLGALAGACRIHGKVELGVQVGRQLLEMEPDNSGRYVLLANLYASGGRWEEVAGVRKLMEERGVRKIPGCSLIEVEGAVTEFIAGETSGHPQAREIYGMVHEMLERIKCAGYVPHVKEVLYDLEEEEDKEGPLQYHSEKLAVAYGLLNTGRGVTIRISKNLRVCKDCHNACKLISKVFDREIVTRDRNRFHHFQQGICSCNDFW